MKKCILIGSVGCGKTTLSQALIGSEISYHKTQAVSIWGDRILDTPGEYLDRRPFAGALMLTSAEAELVILVQSATDPRCMFSPCYAGSFAKDVIGVVTKIDAATDTMIREAEVKLELTDGILGLASKSKGLLEKIGIVLIIIQLVSLIFSIVSQSFAWTNLIGFILPILYYIGAKQCIQ